MLGKTNLPQFYFYFDRYDESGQFGPNGMMVSLGERVVTIEGTVDAICKAEKIISQRLRDYMEKDLRNSANNPNIVLVVFIYKYFEVEKILFLLCLSF